MQTIILAAGRGTRLGNKTTALPKSLLSLKNKPIIDYTLARLSEIADNSTLVVGGFEFEKLVEHLNNTFPNIPVLKNPDYKKGNLISLLAAKEQINDSFCVTNADHVFSKEILEKVYQEPQNITVVCDFDRKLTDDDMKIKKKARGGLEQMSKTLKEFEGGYIGMTVVPKEKLPLYWETAHKVLESEGDQVHVESVVNELASNEETVEILDVSGSVWCEVDTEADLANAQKMISQIFP